MSKYLIAVVLAVCFVACKKEVMVTPLFEQPAYDGYSSTYRLPVDSGYFFYPRISEAHAAELQHDKVIWVHLKAEEKVDSIPFLAELQFQESDSAPSLEVYVPNAFTPNGDGINDLFTPVFSSQPVNYSLRIFSRWGEEMFSSNDVSVHWDGRDKQGSFLSADTYFYVVEYSFLSADLQRLFIGQERKGWFKLLV